MNHVESGDTISASALAGWIKSKKKLDILDVRQPWEVAIAAIEGSKNIPLNELPDHLEELSKDVPLVVLCQHGVRSLQAVRWLRDQGFGNAINLAGGMGAWARQAERGDEG